MEVVKGSIPIIRIFSFLEPFIAIMFICAGVLRAGGDVVYVMLTALVGLWFFRIGIAYCLYRYMNLGVYAIMIGISSDFIICALMYGIRAIKGKWKYIKL